MSLHAGHNCNYYISISNLLFTVIDVIHDEIYDETYSQ